MQQVDLKEQRKSLIYLDSMMVVKQAQLDSALRMGFLLDKQPRRKAVFEVAFVFLTLGDCHLLPQFFNQCIVLFAQTLR